jgi:hypothetical protein
VLHEFSDKLEIGRAVEVTDLGAHDLYDASNEGL